MFAEKLGRKQQQYFDYIQFFNVFQKTKILAIWIYLLKFLEKNPFSFNILHMLQFYKCWHLTENFRENWYFMRWLVSRDLAAFWVWLHVILFADVSVSKFTFWYFTSSPYTIYLQEEVKSVRKYFVSCRFPLFLEEDTISFFFFFYQYTLFK